MAESVFRGSLEFFAKLGVYDVVLPFLLVFTIVFAILEKTKIYGSERIGEKEVTRKNLNAMTAFVMAFFVVASSQLVAVINKAVANMVLLLMLVICFMILVGSFHQQTKEGFFLKGTYKNIFMVIMFIGIALIFLHALGWLEAIYNYVIEHWDGNVVASIVLIVLVLGFMLYVTHEQKAESKKEEA